MIEITKDEIQRLLAAVDYSEALTIDATEDEVRTACAVAKKYGFRSIAAFPRHLSLVVEELQGSQTLSMIVVGFPCGANTTYVKCKEAEEGLKAGANDLDMVMNLGAFKDGNYAKVEKEILDVKAVAEPFHVPTKVIIEVGVLSEEEKVTAANLVADTGVTFVKTCTGFGPGRATVHDIMLLKKTVGDRVQVKASGGVTTLEDGVILMRAGADVVAMRIPAVEQLKAMGWD